jgi:hypothetical protein
MVKISVGEALFQTLIKTGQQTNHPHKEEKEEEEEIEIKRLIVIRKKWF